MMYRIKKYTIVTSKTTRYMPQRRKHFWNKWTWDGHHDLYPEAYKTHQDAIDKINEWKEFERNKENITYETIK